MQDILDKYKKRALTVDNFCFTYSVGRTLAYAEIAAGKLHSVKLGKKRLIPTDSAEEWLSNLERHHNQSPHSNQPDQRTIAEIGL